MAVARQTRRERLSLSPNLDALQVLAFSFQPRLVNDVELLRSLPNSPLFSDKFAIPGYKSSSLFASPRLFVGFTAKDSEAAAMSPTSILDTKPFSPVRNPFFTEKTHKKLLPWEVHGDSSSIGLGIVDSLLNEEPDRTPDSPQSRMVLFSSRLKIQMPSVSVDSPQSPIEFGVKNKTTQLALLSPDLRSPKVYANVVAAAESPGFFSGCLAAGEMELSEDYTRVVTHGPNPKTTHIFDNCIIKSSPNVESKFLEDGFLTSCHACEKSLGEGKDIHIYRGGESILQQRVPKPRDVV